MKIDGEIDQLRQVADSDACAKADAWYTTQEIKLIERLKAAADTAASKASQVVASLDVAEFRRKMREMLTGVISGKIDDLIEEGALASKIESRLHGFLRSLERKAQVSCSRSSIRPLTSLCRISVSTGDGFCKSGCHRLG